MSADDKDWSPVALAGAKFVIRHPHWSNTVIVVSSLALTAVPVIGPAFLLFGLLGGLIGTAIFRRKFRAAERQWQLEQTTQMPELDVAAPHQPVIHVDYSDEMKRAIERSEDRERRRADRDTAGPQPKVSDLAKNLSIDPRPFDFDEQVEVAGETHYTRQARAVFRKHGREIPQKGATLKDLQCVLVPEPWNEYDSNAVAVVIDGHQVGHLPAELAEDYSPPLLRLAQRQMLCPGQARVWAKADSGVVRVRVTILIPAWEEI
jgi:hypothetical protein